MTARDLNMREVLLVTPTDATEAALLDVAEERVRQVDKWGVQSLPDGTSERIYAVERDLTRERTDDRAEADEVTWTDVLTEEVYEALAEEDPGRLRAELVQVAAVALSWVEDLDRRSAGR